MKLDELYPYWDAGHEDLLEVVAFLTEAQLESIPADGARTLRQILLQFIRDERYWAGHLVAGYAEYRPLPNDYPTGKALVEALRATREVTARVLEPLGVDGLRAVRTVPGDPATNRYESNSPISWLFWHVMELEMILRGQLKQRMEDQKRIGL